MGYQKYLKELWTKPKANMPELWKSRLMDLRKEPTTVKLDHPTRPDKARMLGYKAKQGIFVVRQKIIRGGRQRPDIKGGRRTAHSGQRKNLDLSYQAVAERRAAEKYKNCEVLNSYYLAHDGLYYWYEVILVDRNHPGIINDPHLGWIAFTKDRVGRGLTSAQRKSRGLRGKGKGFEKFRPSKKANKK